MDNFAVSDPLDLGRTDEPPYQAVPIVDERAREDEQALIESSAPINGTSDRRARLQAARTAHRAALAAKGQYPHSLAKKRDQAMIAYTNRIFGDDVSSPLSPSAAPGPRSAPAEPPKTPDPLR